MSEKSFENVLLFLWNGSLLATLLYIVFGLNYSGAWLLLMFVFCGVRSK